MSNVITQSATAKLFVQETVQGTTGTKTVRITPELAEQWLEWNGGNRRLSMPHVIKLSKEIEAGNWMLNGQCLVFSDEGNLLDGQHRLGAIAYTGKSILTDVRFGVDPESFKTIDQGKKRNAADVLSIEGLSNSSHVAAAAKIVIVYNTVDGNDSVAGTSTVPSNSTILKWVNSNPQILDDVTLGLSLYLASDRTVLSASKIAAYIFISRGANPETEKFFTLLCTGVPMTDRGPVYHLRRSLIRSKVDKTRSLNRTIERKMVVKAWNYWSKGKEMNRLNASDISKSRGTARFE